MIDEAERVSSCIGTLVGVALIVFSKAFWRCSTCNGYPKLEVLNCVDGWCSKKEISEESLCFHEENSCRCWMS